jgi:hypothetical protein
LLAASDEATRWINSAIGANGDFGNIAGALRKNVCNESSPDTSGVGPQPPFTGGQCDGVLYNVSGKFDYGPTPIDSTEETLELTGQLVGPIDGFFPVRTGRTLKNSAGEVYKEQVRYALRCANEDNTFIQTNFGPYVDVYSCTEGPPVSNCTGTQDTDPPTFGPYDLSVTRADGQPDNCGSLPADPVPEYNDYSETISITYEDNSETSITEDIDITLGPLIVGIGGILYAPVTVGTGDITLNGTLELSPEIKVDLFPDGLFGGGGNTDSPAPDPGEPDPEPTTPDDRRRIIGAIVTVTDFDESIAKVTQVAQGDSPDIFVPRTGNVSFYIDTPGGQAWTEPKPLRNIREYVPCPAREGAVDVAVTSGTGFTLAVTPVYAELALA